MSTAEAVRPRLATVAVNSGYRDRAAIIRSIRWVSFTALDLQRASFSPDALLQTFSAPDQYLALFPPQVPLLCRPFGSEDWMIKIAQQLGLESTLHSRGRQKRS